MHMTNVKVNGAVISGLHEKNIDTEKEFTLFQNYPNPFNPSTQISFQLVKAGTISIKIYDVIGNEVNILDSGYHEKGTYSFNWDGRTNYATQAASGVYMCKLQGQNSSKIIKMLLMK